MKTIILLASFLALLNLKLSLGGADGQQQAGGSLCPNALKINTNYEYRNTLHFICLQANPIGPLKLEVIQYSNRQVLFSRPVEELDTNQIATFVDDEGTLRILLAAPTKLNGTSIYSLDSNGQDTREKDTINTQFVSSMAIWRMELNQVWHLAIANQPYYDPAHRQLANASLPNIELPNPKPMLTIHSWRSTYFDNYEFIKLEQDGRVNKLEPMNIFGQEFLIVAMEPHKIAPAGTGFGNKAQKNTSPVDSTIFKLDFSEGSLNWKVFQSLRTSLALDVRAFAITHQDSLQRDYYVAILGQINRREVPRYITLSNGPAHGFNSPDDFGLIIYKFMGDQFMLTNLIPAPGATKLDAISYGSGDSYVIIALLSDYSNQLNLYLFDGLALRPVPTPYPTINMLPPNQQRPRRTMPGSSVHLFMVPATAPTVEVSGQQKRTMELTGEELLPTLPALAISNPSQQIIQRPLNESKPESLYTIPIQEIISENERQINSQLPERHSEEPGEQSAEQSGHSRKRTFVGGSAGRELFDWCKSTISSLLADSFDSMSRQISALPKIDQRRPIELNGDLVIENDLYVTNLLYTNAVGEHYNQTMKQILELPRNNFSDTFDRIQMVHNEIDQVARRIDQILVDDGTQQDVFVPLSFDQLYLQCPNQLSNILADDPQAQNCPYVSEIRTNILNSRNISDLHQQALLTGRSMVITSDVRFEHLVLKGNVDILSTLNGLAIDDIVFKVGPSKGAIVGHKNFSSGLYSSSNLMVDLWNGFPVNRQNYLLSSGDQRVETAIRLNHVIIDSPPMLNSSSRIERLNGIHLDAHLGAISLADESQTFEVPLYFDELHLNGPVNFKTASLLSSINLDELWSSTMFKHSNQNITVPIEFAGSVHISYGGDLLVGGLVNNISFNPETIMMRNKNYTLENPLVVEGDVRVNNLVIYKALNLIQVVSSNKNSMPELSILYDGGEQMITGEKVFDQIHLGGQSSIVGAINGHLNITELYKLANNQGEPHRFQEVRVAGRDIRIADQVQVHVESSINGIPVQDLCNLAIRVNMATPNETLTYNRLRFQGPLQFKKLRCNSVNGFTSLTDAFLTRSGNQRVAGSLNLMGGVIFNTTINIQSSLNEMNVAPLAKAIEQSVNDSRTGRRDFYGDLLLDDLITDRINDLKLADVFLSKSDTPQVVRSTLAFDHLDIENVLIVNKNLITESFNGLNVSDLIHNSLQYDTPQNIYNHIEVDTLHLMPQANLLTNNLNGFDLKRLYSDAVLIDVPQQILAPKTFRAPVEFANRLYLALGIDGLSDQELRYNILLHSDELIEGDLEFNNDVLVKKELEILSNIINDIDVNVFVDSILHETRLLNQNQSFRVTGNGSVRFNDVKLNNLVVGGTIQGLDVSREALLRNHTLSERVKSITQPGHELTQTTQPGLRVYSQYGQPGAPDQKQQFRTSATPFRQPTPYLLPSTPMPGPLPPVPYRPPAAYVPLRKLTLAPVPPAPHVVYVQHPQVSNLQAWSQLNDSKFVWRPSPEVVNATKAENYPLVDPKYLEYYNMLQAAAIRDLSQRINKYLSVSFYYEIAQKHPELGPLLNWAENPVEPRERMLLLKATGSNGEPCLRKGQSIAVHARLKDGSRTFTLSSRLTETSNPIAVESIVLHQNNHYLIVLEGGLELTSQLLVSAWDQQVGRYVPKERINLDGHPTAMKVFAWDNSRLGCIALAMPKTRYQNLSGPPVLYCQTVPLGNFSARQIFMAIDNVFNLDVELNGGTEILLATLSQRNNEQMAFLRLHSYDMQTKGIALLSSRRMASPTRLHFFRSGPKRLQPIQLIVTEGITSSDHSEAITRIFNLQPDPSLGPGYPTIGTGQLKLRELQTIRDSQFWDIQTVQLDEFNSMIFLQSESFISVYAPTLEHQQSSKIECLEYSLVHRVPTKGANRFLVFNEKPLGHLEASNRSAIQQLLPNRPLKHFLVLSTDDCEQRKYSTVILRAMFR